MPRIKITEEVIAEVQDLLKTTTMTGEEIAQQMNISPAAVSRIKSMMKEGEKENFKRAFKIVSNLLLKLADKEEVVREALVEMTTKKDRQFLQKMQEAI